MARTSILCSHDAHPKLKAGLPSSGFCGGRQLVGYPRFVRGFNVGRVKSVLQRRPSSAGALITEAPHSDTAREAAAVRYVHMRTICTRFADSSRHVVSSGVRDTQRRSFPSLVTLLVAPRGAECSLNDEFPRVERYPRELRLRPSYSRDKSTHQGRGGERAALGASAPRP